MLKTYIKSIPCHALLLGMLMLPLSLAAQQEMTPDERVKILEYQKKEEQITDSLNALIQNAPIKFDKLALPPLTAFLDAVSENATVKRARSQVEQTKNEYRIQKRDWMNYIKLSGMYSFGRFNVLNNTSDEFTPMYQTSMASAQHNFSIGAGVNISVGDIVNRSLKLKKHRYDIEQLQYTQDEVMEVRRLRVLEAYNAVTEQLATIKAKAETAALYNAQMKISENDFIQGKIDIIALSLERARRSGAVTNYEQSRVTLHNSIILLEMLTNVKIIQDK